MYKAKVTVVLRPSILDPQGKAVQHALDSLGMREVKDVRIGKYVEVNIETSRKEDAENIIRQACTKLLANPVMEDYAFSVEKV